MRQRDASVSLIVLVTADLSGVDYSARTRGAVG